MPHNKGEESANEIIFSTFKDIVLLMGRKISSQFLVDANRVACNEHDTVSDTVKPIMRVARSMFKKLLDENFDTTQLSILTNQINKAYLDNINSNVSRRDKSPIRLGVQLLFNMGIPMLKNIIGHAAKHHRKLGSKEFAETHEFVAKKFSGYHPVHRGPKVIDHPLSSAAKHHGEVAHEVKAQYHRMTSGNRGSKK